MPAKGKPFSQHNPPAFNKLLIMKKLTLLSGVILFTFLSQPHISGQNTKTEETKLDSVVIEAFRAGKNTPVSYSSKNREEILKSSPAHSVPMILSLLPSVVSSSEGGNGLGYSSMRIRGSEGSRINVTLNGISLNDSESQEVFWVNIPSFSSFIQDIQVQRGVGTSTNGPGAFGASINMRTIHPNSDAYAVADFGAGSYNTFLTSIGAGTGISEKGFSFDVRFSRNTTDGYIRNAKADVKSLFASAGYHTPKNSIKLNYIYGDQKTGITWEGISREQMALDRRYNPAGEYYDAAGNPRYYDNETDNYTQHHLQFVYSHSFSEKLLFSGTFHYTKGDGYYENYKSNRKFSSYGLPSQTLGANTYSRSDIIIRQALDNNYYAFNGTLKHNLENVSSAAGISYSYYDGDHFGKVLWAMYNGNVPNDFTWYINSGYKGDLSAFVRSEVSIGDHFVAYGDLQLRRVNYSLRGDDKDFVSLNWDRVYSFFNPKTGITVNTGAGQFYASVAIGHKEPSRSDIKESVKAQKASDITPERLTDYEMGYRLAVKNLSLSANLFLMEYRDQLVPTGRLSETGYVIKENVDKSYRRGLEITASWRPLNLLSFDGNITISSNKILDYTQFLDQFDSYWNLVSQRQVTYSKTDISFSPSATGMVMVTIHPFANTTFSLNGKYVGKQYLDNTSNEGKSVPSYFLTGFSATRSFELKGNRYLDLHFFADNLLNKMYFSNGWIYSAEFTNGTPYIEEGLYPQAGINFTVKASLRF